MQGSILGNMQVTLKAITQNLRMNDGVDAAGVPSSLYTAKSGATKKAWNNSIKDGYQGVSTFVASYVRLNSGSHGVVQVDNERSFYRAFISNGHGVRSEYPW